MENEEQASQRSGEQVADPHAHYIAIWSKAVETQMHFNEMSVKSRQLGLAFAAAALGLSVVLLSEKKDFSLTVFGWDLHVSVLLLVAVSLALVGVRQLDLNVYHRMLRGAVTFGEDFEEHYMKQIFKLEKGMTQAISHFSRHSDAAYKAGADGKYTYQGKDRISAERKIKRFYIAAIASVLLAAAGLFFVTNFHEEPAPPKSEVPPPKVAMPAGDAVPEPPITERAAPATGVKAEKTTGGEAEAKSPNAATGTEAAERPVEKKPVPTRQ